MISTRKPLIAGNWKMNGPHSIGETLTQSLIQTIQTQDVEVLICPPFTFLEKANDLLINSAIQLGAQNLHNAESGAYTGEISASMLKEVGCTHVLIGHSERRQLFGETNQSINKKIKTALTHGLIPVFCVGETLEERESKQMLSVIESQIKEGLNSITFNPGDLIIAYEPVWAIGTGKVATPEQAQEVHAAIRSNLESLYSKSISQNTHLLYGGSVNPGNISELINCPDIDGALVGGASLKADQFCEIIQLCLAHA